MAAGTLNITIEQGADFIRVLTLKDSLGATIDITGYSFASEIKDSTCGDIVASFSFTILDQITNKGQVRWYMPAALTATIPAECVNASDGSFQTTPYLYDVDMTNNSSEISRIIMGKANVSPEVTS